MNTLLELLRLLPLLRVAEVAILALLLMLAWLRWEELKFFFLRIWYEVPLIGKLAQLSRDDNRDLETKWFNSEVSLCHDFYQYYPIDSGADTYERATSYLQKAQQINRRSTPWYGWCVIFVLLVAEAGSFGVLLAAFISPNSTLSQQNIYGWLVAIVFALAMLFITHEAGGEIYVNGLRSKVKQMYRDWYEKHPKTPLDIYGLGEVALDSTHVDDEAPTCVQLANRVDSGNRVRYLPSRFFTYFAIVLIVFFSFATFFLRNEVLRSVLSGQDQPFGIESLADERKAAFIAFGILSALFVAVQIVSGSLGYFYGFRGRVANEAAAIRGRFATKEQFVAHQARLRAYVERIAQQKLTKLQTKISGASLVPDADEKFNERTFKKFRAEFVSDSRTGTNTPGSSGPGASQPQLRSVSRTET